MYKRCSHPCPPVSVYRSTGRDDPPLWALWVGGGWYVTLGVCSIWDPLRLWIGDHICPMGILYVYRSLGSIGIYDHIQVQR